tara:strand:- start:37 stop:630 length:594 start_codon:yes stop_codon:yes gene_type:complete
MNIEELNKKWITRKWWGYDSPEEIRVLNEIELFITDFSLWSVIEQGKPIENFKLQFGKIHLIYTLWYEGILQYVGETTQSGRRWFVHHSAHGDLDRNGNRRPRCKDIRVFDEIKYFKIPDIYYLGCHFMLKPEIEWQGDIRKDIVPGLMVPKLHLVIEKEIRQRYKLYLNDRNEEGYTNIRTSMNYLNSEFEQLSLF